MEKLKGLPPEEPAICILSDGTVKGIRIGRLVDRPEDLKYATVLLPPGCGAVTRGMFQSSGTNSALYDVADIEDVGGRRRYKEVAGDGRWIRVRLGVPNATPEESDVPPDEFAKSLGMKEAARVEVSGVSEEGPETKTCLVYLRKVEDRKELVREVKLGDHTAEVAKWARAMAQKTGLADLDLYEAAGRWHDEGKREEIWQAAVGGSVDDPLAKPKRQFAPGRLGGFRHEFSSLRKAEKAGLNELALHLIASHHGWARPFFLPRAFDRREVRKSEQTALECVRRFGRLQERWGAWRLAYLEAVFKAADGWVSENEKKEKQAEEQPDYA
jgi:CRISPR-associated endonuclease/helicase Cas3